MHMYLYISAPRVIPKHPHTETRTHPERAPKHPQDAPISTPTHTREREKGWGSETGLEGVGAARLPHGD